MRPVLPVLVLLAACQPDGGLTKFNPAPEASILAPGDGDTVVEGSALGLRGSVTDANHAPSELLARWFLDGVEACAEAAPASSGETACEVTVPSADTVVRLEVRDPEGATGSAEIALTVVQDAAPQVAITAPATDARLYSDRLVRLAGTATDAEDAPADLALRWVSSRDGELSVSNAVSADGAVEAFATLSRGEHALQLFATDTAGNTTSASVLVEVGAPNSAPDCAITAPAPGATATLGDAVAFSGEVSDADEPATGLLVAWASDKDGALGGSTPTSAGRVSFPFGGLSADTHVVTMTVTDELGATCVAETTLTVGTFPELLVEEPVDADTVNEGETLYGRALVSDAEDLASDLVVRWESDLDGLLAEAPADSAGQSRPRLGELSVGEHVLTVTATDTSGLASVAYVNLTVNGLPTAPIVSLSPAAPDTDDALAVSLDAAATDPEGDRVSYAYTWFRDGVVSGASTSATLPASATAKGERWTVEVVASDGLGEGPVGSATVTIADSAPTLASITLTPDPATVSDTLACAAGATADADGDTVSVTTAWSVDGVPLARSASTLSGAFARGDVVTCTLTPVAAGVSGTALVESVTIGNSAPSMAGVTITPAVPRAGDVLTCSEAGWSDADGDASASTFAWSVNGRAAGTGSTLAGGFVGGDTVTCTATPWDGTDAGSPVSGSVTVDNTPPVLASVTLTPGAPYEGDTLTCTPGATTDADGTTAFTYAYGWTVNGVSLGVGSATLTSASFDAGDVLACSVTPNDGTEDGAAVRSSSVTVGNSVPSIASVSISPDPATRSSTLTCAWSGFSDADGDADASTVAWTVDGVAAGTGRTLAGPFDAGDVVVCTVTPNDGTTTGTTVSDSLTISNSAPSLSVSLSPGTVRTNDTLTGTATTSDADGDSVSVSYAWYVDGVRVAATGSTLSGATWFDRGEVVYVVATASDGAATGTATSGSVTVANTAPTTPTIDITPGSPRAGDSLVCSIVTASTDPDGDPITYDFTWDDGTSILSAATTTTRAGDTVPGSYVGASETWTCEVVADDGTDTSAPVEDYVTASTSCDSTREVEYGGRCYYLDGSGGSCLSGYELAPQTVLYTIASSFAGKTYKTRVSDNCCIWNSESDQDFGMTSSCNSAGPFRAGEPTPGGAGCTNVFNRNTYQLTFCRSR